MEGVEVFRAAVRALCAGERVCECVVLASEGSVARAAGARMLVLEGGEQLGTIGGGAPEWRASQEARRLLAEGGPPQIARFDHASTGSVCGGAQLVGMRLLGADDLAALEELLACVDERGRGRLCVTWGVAGATSRFERAGAEDAACAAGGATYEGSTQGGTYTEWVSAAERAVVFGGGHVGRELVALLAHVGFDVTVFDDRPYLARPENFPAAREVVLGTYEDVAASLALTSDDYVCVMTHGHAADELVVAQALAAHPRYLGCMGSRKKRAVLERVLVGQGFDTDELARVERPVGLAIGAVTPAEIAVSICARMVQVRAEARGKVSSACPSRS